ncbi:MAG: hypothetical protein GY861_27650 [bacterium]|nr:hypothetical protein [bacterium]
MRLSISLVIVLLFSCLIISFGATYFYYQNGDETLTEHTWYHLETAAQSRAHHVTSFLDDVQHSLEIAATHSDLSNDELRAIADIEKSFDEVFLLDSSGKAVASSDESHLGLDFSDRDFFVNGKDATFISEAFYSEMTNRSSIAVSTPYSGGVLFAILHLDELNRITTDSTGLGDSGEIYIIDKKGYMITKSRFTDDSELNQKVSSVNAKQCLMILDMSLLEHLEPTTSNSYADYRGEQVFGVFIPIPEMQWCLLAEINEAEVSQRVRTEYFNNLLVTAIGITFFVCLLGFFIGKKLEHAYIKEKEGRTKICVPCLYIFLISLFSVAVFFLIVISFFDTRETVNIWMHLPDLLFLFVASITFGYSLKIKSDIAARFINPGAGLLILAKLIEIPVQEYSASIVSLSAVYWLPSYLLIFAGFLYILFAFREVVK